MQFNFPKSSEYGSRVLLRIAISVATVAVHCKPLRADYVIYSLPGVGQPIVLHGVVKQLPGGQIDFQHALGSLVLNSDKITVVKAPSRTDSFRRLRFRASQSNLSNDYLLAAQEALRLGLLPECLNCCDDATRLDPNHPTVQLVTDVRLRMGKQLDDQSDAESKLRDLTSLQRFRVAHSHHFTMLHSIDDSQVGRKSSRAEFRLALLETIYSAFYLHFALRGVQLEAPAERLMVLLFSEESDFQRYSATINPRLVFAGGYWSSKDNVSVFYDQATTPSMKRLTEIVDDLKKQKSRARGTAFAKHLAQQANAVDLIARMLKTDADIEVVTHETVHQIAGNSGLLPRNRIASNWAHEGLAAFFESPFNSVWSGVGSVNSTRLEDHRIVHRDPRRQGIASIISDQLFSNATTQLEAVEAYGQAWALTHFLMHTRFTQLMAFYQACNALPDPSTANDRQQIFIDTIGAPETIEKEFSQYMSHLKTELEHVHDLQMK